jgi:hypothetical protein
MSEFKQALVNHMVLVLDASGSMDHHKQQLIKVTDDHVAYLAKRSKELEQETRLTVYSFDETVRNLVWDTDVLRMPSISELYRIGGMTALVDATVRAVDDLETIPVQYGDHAFFLWVWSDGLDNASRGGASYSNRMSKMELNRVLSTRLGKLPDNWTVVAMAPTQQARMAAQDLGFPRGNIDTWDATSQRGMEEAATSLRTTTDNYMAGRASGIRGSTSLFVGGNVDAAAVKAANLKPLPTAKRKIVVVVKTDDSFEKIVKPANTRRKVAETGWFVKIEDYVKRINKGMYPLGDAFYELVKTEQIQGDKEIAVVDVNTNQVFVGHGARQLLGLPAEKRTVKPDQNAGYKIFVQSNSLNRHLPHGCSVMVLDR